MHIFLLQTVTDSADSRLGLLSEACRHHQLSDPFSFTSSIFVMALLTDLIFFPPPSSHLLTFAVLMHIITNHNSIHPRIKLFTASHSQSPRQRYKVFILLNTGEI